MRVADYIALRCAEAGAKHVFLVTGGGAMHLNDAFGRSPDLSVRCFHHEQSAAMAAESYYRVSNRLAVLNVTTGPGGINALNGVYGAYVDSIGMLVVSGQVKRETYLRNYDIPLRQLGDQEVDIVSMVRPIVKYGTVLQDPLRVREVMDKAVFLARHGRPGPVWVDVPVDVQSIQVDVDALQGFDLSDLKALQDDPDVTANTVHELRFLGEDSLESPITDIVAQLHKAKRPVLFVGNGVRLSDMMPGFEALVEQLGIPVVTGWNAHDILTNESPYYAGRPGTVGDRAGNFTVQNADFLLVLGCRLNIRQVSYNWKSFASKAWKAMVDVDGAELEKPTLSMDLKVQADLRLFIPKLAEALGFGYQPSHDHQHYLAWCRERVARYPVLENTYPQQEDRLNPYHFMELLFESLGPDDVIVTGNGSACVMSFQAAKLKKGQRLFTNSGDASMGYDLPAAIGASIALGGKRVICLAGDGSLMMNLQELQTLVGLHLPVKVIILSNDGYHSIRQTQKAYFSDNLFGIGPSDGVSLPDFPRLAEALGLPSIRVTREEGWTSESVRLLLESEGPALIDVVVDPDQPFSPKLASRKLPDGSMVSPSLEDMAPFLPEDEMRQNRLI